MKRGALSISLPRQGVARFFKDWDTGIGRYEATADFVESLEAFIERHLKQLRKSDSHDALDLLTDAFHDFLNHLTVEFEPIINEKDGSFDGFEIVVSGRSGTVAEWWQLVDEKKTPLKDLIDGVFVDDTFELFRDEERGVFRPDNRRRIVAAWLRSWADELDGPKQ